MNIVWQSCCADDDSRRDSPSASSQRDRMKRGKDDSLTISNRTTLFPASMESSTSSLQDGRTSGREDDSKKSSSTRPPSLMMSDDSRETATKEPELLSPFSSNISSLPSSAVSFNVTASQKEREVSLLTLSRKSSSSPLLAFSGANGVKQANASQTEQTVGNNSYNSTSTSHHFHPDYRHKTRKGKIVVSNLL